MFALMSAHGDRNHIAGARIIRLLLLLHLYATLGGDRDGINQIHTIDTLFERPLKSCVTRQCRFPVCYLSVVTNRDALDVAFAELAEKKAQLLREFNIGMH